MRKRAWKKIPPRTFVGAETSSCAAGSLAELTSTCWPNRLKRPSTRIPASSATSTRRTTGRLSRPTRSRSCSSVSPCGACHVLCVSASRLGRSYTSPFARPACAITDPLQCASTTSRATIDEPERHVDRHATMVAVRPNTLEARIAHAQRGERGHADPQRQPDRALLTDDLERPERQCTDGRDSCEGNWRPHARASSRSSSAAEPPLLVQTAGERMSVEMRYPEKKDRRGHEYRKPPRIRVVAL